MPAGKRASRVASPGATRLTLTGIMAVSDDFDRVRVLLMERPGDSSWAQLAKEIPTLHENYRTPYELHDPDTEDVRGVFWAVLPGHRKKYWLETATELRGRYVRAEVTVRPFSYRDKKTGERIMGASLDLAMLEEETA